MGECSAEENRNDWEMLISFLETQKMLEQKQFRGVNRVWEIINSLTKQLQIKGYVGLEWAWARALDLSVMDLPRPSSPWRA